MQGPNGFPKGDLHFSQVYMTKLYPRHADTYSGWKESP